MTNRRNQFHWKKQMETASPDCSSARSCASFHLLSTTTAPQLLEWSQLMLLWWWEKTSKRIPLSSQFSSDNETGRRESLFQRGGEDDVDPSRLPHTHEFHGFHILKPPCYLPIIIISRLGHYCQICLTSWQAFSATSTPFARDWTVSSCDFSPTINRNFHHPLSVALFTTEEDDTDNTFSDSSPLLLIYHRFT